MRSLVRRKSFKRMSVMFLSFVLAFGTLFAAPALYAEETVSPGLSVESSAPDTAQDPNTPVNEAENEVQDPKMVDAAADEILQAPQNLQVSAVTSTSITLTWDPVGNNDDYNVYYGDGNYAGWTGTNSIEIKNLDPKTTYSFYVVAGANGEPSKTIEATTAEAKPGDPDPPPKEAPKNLRVVDITHNSATLEWDFLEDYHDIQIYNAVTGAWIAWGNFNTRTLSLTPETEYSIYIVWEWDKVKQEYKSNVVTFRSLEDTTEYEEPPLQPPSYLKVNDVTDDSVTFHWGASPEATGYDFYVNGERIDGTLGNSATSVTYAPAGGLEIGKSYTFEVGAQKEADGDVLTSAKSNEVTITWGKLEAPQDLQVVTATRSAATFGWAPVPGATSYDIYQDNALVDNSESNRYLATGLTEGQPYSYKVVAKNSLWESEKSEEVKVVPGSNYNIVTYYMSWAANPSQRNFMPSDLDISQITHINYAFSDLCWKKVGSTPRACQNEDIPLQSDYVHNGEMIIGDPEVDFDNFRAFAEIKDRNPQLKLMISVGGWSWSNHFSNMAATEITRRTFANSVVKFLREYGFDGVDIDWEYPVEGGEDDNSRSPADKENFTLMAQAVREALDAAGSEDGKYYLQTIASGQGDNFVVNADLANSVKYLDFINIMTYDYSGSWENLAHHNAPLYHDKNHPLETASRTNVEGGALGHLNGGVPKHKLVLGVPFYGKGWQGCPADGQYQTCTGPTPPGSWEGGIYDFWHLENNYVNKNGYVRYWNEAAKVAYLYNNEKQIFITYNDKSSMTYAASLVKSLDIAGVMSWDSSGDRNKTLSTRLVRDLPIDGKVNAEALAAPQQLSVASRNANSIQLKWNASEGATGYEVYVNKQLAGTTNGTQYTVSSLAPSTNYNIYVLAVDRDGDDIRRVSIASNEVRTSTVSPPSSGGGSSSGGGGSTTTPPAKETPKPADPAKDQLETKITKDGDKLIVTLPTEAAVKTIDGSKATTFRVVVSDEAGQVEVIVTKEILAAIAEKGEQAALTIIANGVEYTIPVHAIPRSTDIKITIGSPSQSIIDLIYELAKKKGLKLLVSPLEFKIEQLHPDQTTTEISNFGKYDVSRVFKINAKGLNKNRTTGAFYLPGMNDFRSVPTLFDKNSDGTVPVELKHKGNGIYIIAESGFNFQDVTMEWARKDVEGAVAKLIVSGDSVNEFGVKRSSTRAEIASMLVRALGIVPDETGSTFTDVDAQSEYAKDIEAAKKIGLIKGRTETTFDPNGLVTRQEMAVMLANAMVYAGKANDANPASLDRFEDRSAISSYATASLALMVEQQIILGVSDTKLDPRSNITKAQAAVTVMRTLRALGLTN